jgi:iron complex outermembrane recepter protein
MLHLRTINYQPANPMTKNFFLLLWLAFPFVGIAQSDYFIKGKILDENNSPIVGATVRIVDTSIGSISDSKGEFEFKNLLSGDYSIEVSFVGYIKENINVSVNIQSANDIIVVLRQDEITLKEVTVISSRRLKELHTINKIDVDLKDLPVTVHGIERKIIDQKGAISLEEAMKNVTGVRTRNTYGGFQHFHIRGMEQFVLLVDGVRDERHNISQSAPSTNLAAVEGIDVLKGPSSVMFGHSALGGIINVRRRQPTQLFKANFQSSYGSFNTRNIMAGAGGAITDKLSFRTDFGVGGSDGFRGLGYNYTNAYLSLKYKPAEKHTLQFNIQANDDFYSTDTGIPVLADGTLVPNMNPLTRYNDPQDFLKNKRVDLQFNYQYQISDKLKLTNLTSYFIDDINYFSTEELTFTANQDSLVRSFPFYFNHQTKPIQNQLELSGEYKLGSIQNKFVLGHSISILDRKTFRGNITGPGTFTTVSVVNPVLNQGAIFIEDNRYQARMETVNGFFGQNWFNFTEKFKALVAVRVDVFNGDYFTDQVDNNRNLTSKGEVSKLNIVAPTYRGGLVYQPTKSLSVYSSYNTYFKPTRTVAPNGDMFDPETGYQGELGVRLEQGDKFSANIAGFSLARTNILQAIPGGGFENIGSGTSNGFELDLSYNPIQDLSFRAGYSFAHTEIQENKGDIAPNPNAGNRLPFAPQHLVHSWLSYEASTSLLKGLGLGMGVNYTSDNYTNNANTLKLDAYYLLDAALWYRFNRYEIKLNVNNLTDQFYYRDAIFGNQFFVGPSRNFLVSFRADF